MCIFKAKWFPEFSRSCMLYGVSDRVIPCMTSMSPPDDPPAVPG